MDLAPARLEVTVDGESGSARLAALPATVAVGPIEVEVGGSPRAGLTWRVANRGDVGVRVRSVALVLELLDVVEPVRMFRNGYQSWSPTGVATFGVDRDPSTVANLEFLQAVHHADQRRALDGELRSEWVTLLASAVGGSTDVAPVLVGFEAGTEHDGTLRLRRAASAAHGRGDAIELWAEAFLGDALLAAGEARTLHRVVVDDRHDAAPATKLDAWARTAGRASTARVHAPYQVGWCSWYHYFGAVSERDLRANLALAGEWPFDVFQLDDGYQSAIGDWLRTNERFPSSLDVIAESITRAGRTPGLWLAPFLVAPDSEVATAHPEWIARNVENGVDRGPLFTWWNPDWGGGQEGFMYGLDTTRPEVLAHLEHVARSMVDAGFRYLKLDFTFSPSADGGYADASRTPAQRVRAGFDAIRRGAGEDTFVLGCGAPLANVVGVVDGNRIGQDVAPRWEPGEAIVAGYRDVQPATKLAYANTVTRAFMHRRLWCNDPDCLMLRTTQTALAPEAARTWAHTVALSGGMALVSDDLALLDDPARRLLDEVLEIGRATDAAASSPDRPPAVADDLMDHPIPGSFAAGGYRLTVDAMTASSTLHRP